MKKPKNWEQLERAFAKMLVGLPKEPSPRRLTRNEREEMEAWNKIVDDFNHDLMEYW